MSHAGRTMRSAPKVKVECLSPPEDYKGTVKALKALKSNHTKGTKDSADTLKIL